MALYSDGLRYPPALKFLHTIRSMLGKVNSVLLLGTGIGSTIGLLNSMGHYPQFTMVDIDEDILSWAIEINGAKNKGKLIPVCESAESFIARNGGKFDLIFIDVFLGREVPRFVMQSAFLARCRQSLNNGGILGLNYIVNNDDDWYRDETTFRSVFSSSELISFDMNRVFVAIVE